MPVGQLEDNPVIFSYAQFKKCDRQAIHLLFELSVCEAGPGVDYRYFVRVESYGTVKQIAVTHVEPPAF